MLSQMNPVHTIPFYLSKIHFCIILYKQSSLFSVPFSAFFFPDFEAAGMFSGFNDLFARLNSARNKVLSVRVLPVDLVTEGRS
jgi:hypothetical protein